MIKGTSQTFKFKIPCSIHNIVEARIVFWQDDYNGPSIDKPLPIIKTKEWCYCSNCNKTITNCDCSDNDFCEIYVTLSFDETLRFTEFRKAYVQAILSLDNGKSWATKQTMFTVYPVYGDTGAGGIDIPIPEPSDNGYIILDGEGVVNNNGN